MSRRKHQHGRKPQKSWHRKGEARLFRKATVNWKEPLTETAYDGAPQALRQLHQDKKAPKGTWDG